MLLNVYQICSSAQRLHSRLLSTLGASSTWPFRLTVTHRPRSSHHQVWMRTRDTPHDLGNPSHTQNKRDGLRKSQTFFCNSVFHEQISIFVVMTNWDQEQAPNLQILGVDCTFLTGFSREKWQGNHGFPQKQGFPVVPSTNPMILYDFLNGNCYGTSFLPKPR